MTRKDYTLIAEALYRSMPVIDYDSARSAAEYDAWARVVVALSDALEADNQQFDRQRFQHAANWQ